MQNFVSYFFPFVFGLGIGSFLNCIIYRLEIKKSFLKGRSFCPNCKHQLSWQDLIPIFSFVILRGKCRYCKKPISLQYPLVEIAIGVLFILIFQFLKLDFYLDFKFWTLSFIYYILVSCLLVIIFVSDLRHYIIPDEVVFPAILVSGIWNLVSGIFFHFYTKYEILNTIYSALIAAGFFLLIVLVSKGNWMGVGDIKLVFLMGLFLGWPNTFVALFLAFFIGAIIGLGLVFFKNKALKSEIPFGPFLVFGTFVALFWGEKLINFYLGLFI